MVITYRIIVVLALVFINLLPLSDKKINELVDKLSINQKIGQLFMIAATIDEESNSELIARKPYRVDVDYVCSLIKDYFIGGVLWLGKGTPELQKKRASQLREYARQYSSIPIWFGQDLEPSFLPRFGFQAVLNAREIGEKDDIVHTTEVGKVIGTIAAKYDVQLIFAPVVDIHHFPNSPITQNRSFGSTGEQVIKHARALINGIAQADQSAIACIKHFPGHGATVLDSHDVLPSIDVITDDMLFPFESILKACQSCAVMVGHIAVKSCKQLDPATLNSSIIDLIKKYNDNALIVTDALDMRALQGIENKEAKALQAGCHLLLCPTDVPRAIVEIKQAVEQGMLSINVIDNAVKKILKLKLRNQM